MPDFAQQMQWLVEEGYPAADLRRVVWDNLNTHTLASLYETFAPAEARRLLDKIEFHDTPKHGSWLNMAEIELGVLRRQCLDRRIPDFSTLQGEVTAWQDDRNAERVRVDWPFTTADARVKLKRLYPMLDPVKPK